MKYKKFKKIMSLILSYLLFFNIIFSSLVSIDIAKGAYIEGTYNILSSSGGAFTGKSFFNTGASGQNFTNTGNLSFDFDFGNSFSGADFDIYYDYGSQTGSKRLYYDMSGGGPGPYLFDGTFSAFSGHVTKTTGDGYFTGANVNLSNMSDGNYKLKISAFDSLEVIKDSIDYDFTIDRAPPIIISGGSFTGITSNSVFLNDVQLEDSLSTISGAVFKYGTGGLFVLNEPLQRQGGYTYTGSLIGLTPSTSYSGYVEVFDKAGNISTGAIMGFTTLSGLVINGMCGPADTASVGFNNTGSMASGSFCSAGDQSVISLSGGTIRTWSCMGINGGANVSCDAPLLTTSSAGGDGGSIMMTFDNNGQISSGGIVNVVANTLSTVNADNIGYIGLAVNSNFDLSGVSFDSFSGILTGNSCTGGINIDTTTSAGEKIIKCKLNTAVSISTGSTFSFNINGITNPAIPGKYNFTLGVSNDGINPVFKYGGDYFFKDLNDHTAPGIKYIGAVNPNKVVVDFDEPVLLKNLNMSVAGGIGFSGAWIDGNNRLFINTTTQNSLSGYTLSFDTGGISDYNNNELITSTSFTGMGTDSKYLDYAKPYNLYLGTNGVIVDIYGQNDVFSGSIVTIDFGSGITYLTGSIIDFNHIQAKINISSSTYYGNRDINVTLSTGKKYFLPSALRVEKSWSTLVDLVANINPYTNIPGVTTDYKISFPVQKILYPGDKIELQFPSDFNIDNAIFDSGAIVNYSGATFDSSGNIINTSIPKFSVSTSLNKLILTINSGYQVNSNEFFAGKVSGIVNPNVAAGQSYIVNVETKQKIGTVLDSFQSKPIYINPQGVIKGLKYKLVSSTGADITLSGVVISGNGPEGGFEIYTNSNGEATYSGSEFSYYGAYFEMYPKIWNGTNYSIDTNYVFDSQFVSTYLDIDKTVNIILKSGAELVTVSGKIDGLAGKNVTLWVSGNGTYLEKNLGIIGSSQNFSFQVPKNSGIMSVGIRPTFSKDAISTAYSDLESWQPPKPIEINVMTGSISSVNFDVVLPNINFTVLTQNSAGKSLANAHVYVYSPSGEIMGLYGDTDLNGKITFKVLPGTYNYGAYIEGLPTPAEQSINISSLSTSNTGAIIVDIPSKSIAGQVTVNGTPVSKVSLSAFETNKNIYRYTSTDSNGNYKIYAEDGDWEVSGWIPGYGPLDNTGITITAANSQYILNFDFSDLLLSTITGSVALSGGDKIIGANIMAEPTDGDYSKGGYAFTDNNGNYSLLLKNGNYKLRAFHGDYGEIGASNLSVTGSTIGGQNFIITTPKSVTISFTGVGIPQDLTKFEWMIDAFDTTNNKGFNQAIRSLTGFTFNKVPSGTYKMKVNVTGIGEVYSSGVFDTSSNPSIEINLTNANKLVPINGIVSLNSTAEQPKDVFVELKDTTNNKILGTKTTSTGSFVFYIGANTDFQLLAKKPGFKTSNIITGNSGNSGSGSISIALDPVSTTYTVGGYVYSGSVIGSNLLSNQKAFISFQGLNDDGTENSKWYGKELYLSGGNFNLDGIPSDISKGKIIIAVDGFDIYKSSSITLANISSLTPVLTPLASIAKPLITTITPSQGGVITDTSVRFKVILPSSALGNDTEAGQVITKETSAIPTTPGSEPIGGKAKEIKATDSNGNSINSLTQEATIELTYSGIELVNANTGITINDVKNLAVYYYDQSAQSWISMPTVVTSSSGTIFDLTGTTLLSSIGNTDLNETTFTLKAKTDHFTLFTSLVSTSIKNSSNGGGGGSGGGGGGSGGGSGGGGGGGSSGGGGGGGGGSSLTQVSITTGIGVTINNVSKYLGNIEQAIVLKHGNNISEILTITRNGKTVKLTDIVNNTSKTVSNLGKNLVTFAVGDIISASSKGGFELSLGGYTKVNLSANSSIKISEVGTNFLTFENIKGTSTYQFDKRGNGFQYKIRGKIGYATIRGTTLSVTSNANSDTYNLIEGKIDVYNSKLKKTVSLTAGSKYIAYTNGKDELITSNNKKNIPTKKITPCTPYKDLEANTIACTYIIKLKNSGIVKSASYFEPNKSITRAELLSMIMKSAKISVKFDPNYTYSDIKASDWWAPYVSTAKKLNMINPNNPKFEANRPITRAEALTIIMKFKGISLSYNSKYTYSDIKVGDWWGSAVSTAKSKGYISATNKNFNPLSKISRQESAIILYNVFFK